MESGALQASTTSPRVMAVDALRGFALLGILMVNLIFFSGPVEQTFGRPLAEVASPWTYGLVLTFAQGKFYGLFALLFGLGFAVQMDRFAARGEHPGRRFRRRLLVLLGFGLLHGTLLWMGDILAMYAVIGMLLPAFARRKPRTLVIWAVSLLVLFALVCAVLAGFMALGSAFAPQEMARSFAAQEQAAAAKIARSLAAYGSGPYGALFRLRLKELLGNYGMTLSIAPHILAMFLLGLWAWRKGIAQNLEAHRPLLKRLAAWGLGLGLPGNLLYAHLMGQGFTATGAAKATLGFGVYALASPALTVGYAAGLALLVLGPCARLGGWLAAAGRMSLTNYLAQSLVMTTVFYFYGLGLFGRLALPWALGLGAILWVAQVFLSRAWLQRHAQGPLEALWRRLAFGRSAA